MIDEAAEEEEMLGEMDNVLVWLGWQGETFIGFIPAILWEVKWRVG